MTDQTQPTIQLTPREKEVLRLLCSGVVHDRNLAERLGISEWTAKSHVDRITAKLGVSSRPELIARAYRVILAQLTAPVANTKSGEYWKRAKLRQVLPSLLKEGEIPAKVVMAGIRTAGVQAGDTLIRAVARELGIRTYRRGFGPGGQWVWALPEDDSSPMPPSMRSMPRTMADLASGVF